VKALVTGAAGFLGSHLCDRLLADGDEVVGLDDLSTGSVANLAHLESDPRFRFVRHDIREPYDIDAEIIYNFACPASPPAYQKDAVGTTLTGVLGTYHGLRLAERHRARFVQASTSEVYGDPLVHPQTEDYRGNVSPNGPRACYDESKRCAEALCMDFHRQHGLEIRIVRIFNTYGPRMDPKDGRVISNFVVQALRGDPLTVYGDGKQTRSICYVDDLIDGIVRLARHPSETGPVNLGADVELSVLEIAERVVRLTGSKSRLSHEPLPEDDPRQRWPDLTRARTVLGYEPKVSIEEGLRRTIEHFRGRT
jgi:UDP-glucuronate decarboxylase